jgi:very-short-patch-repair endonuclease
MTVWRPEGVRGVGDAEVARVSSLQKGFAHRDQLLAARLTPDGIKHRLKTGRLHERYRGVYLVGRPSIEPLGEEMAAILFLAGRAVLSHASAGAIWGLHRPAPSCVTVTAVGCQHRSRPGLTIHRAATLDPRDIRFRAGLPLTAPARTLLDLAGELEPPELEQALAEARVQRLAKDSEINAAIARAPGRKGAATLRRLLEAGPAYTRTKAERLMLRLIRAAQLPRPLTDVKLCGYTADFLWREQGLIIEVDGYQFHSDPRAFERDRKRDQVHVAAGYRVIRVTWAQMRDEPMAVIARIAQALVVLRAA